VAMAGVLSRRGAPPGMVAGLSIGAYPAAGVAGEVDFDDAVRLVRLRATLMHTRFPSGYGMVAVGGLQAGVLQPLVDRAYRPDEPVSLANFNAPTQFVVSGSDAALDRLAALALQEGA